MRGHVLYSLAGGFLFGIAARSLLPLDLYASVWFAIAALFLFGAAFIVRRRLSRAAFIAAVFFLASGLGIMRMDAGVVRTEPLLDAHVGERIVLEAIVSGEPDARENSTRIPTNTRLLVFASSSETVLAGVLVVAPAHADIAYGDVIRAEGILELPEAFETGVGREFDYAGFLASNGIVYTLRNARIEKTSERHASPLKETALGLKRLFITGLHDSLPEPESGLAAGITVGVKRSLGPELTEDFRRVSLVHVLVLSGYNITIVLSALLALLARAPRGVRFGAAGAVALFFVLMTGGASSAVRAAMMAMIALFARGSGRTFAALRVLALVAVSMLIWNPYLLLFDPGFQLSFLATAGLIIFTPPLCARLSWVTPRFAVREIVASSIGTQLMVLPLLVYQSGQISVVSLPANLFALVPIPLAMLLSCVSAVAGLTLGPLAPIFALPAYLILKYVISIAEIFAALPFASIQVPAFSPVLLAVVYGLIMGALFLRWRRKASMVRLGEGETVMDTQDPNTIAPRAPSDLPEHGWGRSRPLPPPDRDEKEEQRSPLQPHDLAEK